MLMYTYMYCSLLSIQRKLDTLSCCVSQILCYCRNRKCLTQCFPEQPSGVWKKTDVETDRNHLAESLLFCIRGNFFLIDAIFLHHSLSLPSSDNAKQRVFHGPRHVQFVKNISEYVLENSSYKIRLKDLKVNQKHPVIYSPFGTRPYLFDFFYSPQSCLCPSSKCFCLNPKQDGSIYCTHTLYLPNSKYSSTQSCVPES